MAKKIKVVFLMIGGILSSVIGSIVLFFLAIYLLMVTFGPCENNIKSSISSLDGKYVAHTFTRDCGATTAESYQLTILKSGKALKNKGGNTFVSKERFDVEWTGDKVLTVTYPVSASTFEMDEKVGSVTITYVGKN